ncbi:Ankyrin-2 [Dactylellina cionopaga]|nr:Ankyrin-2 [Dactylellina cionopaga]
MAEYTETHRNNPSRWESTRPGIERKPIGGHNNSAVGNPAGVRETTTGPGSQSNSRLENSADYPSSLNNIEHLSIESKHTGQEHLDAADFYLHNANPKSMSSPSVSSSKTLTSSIVSQKPCKMCLVPSCVMNGGSVEAQRLLTTIAKMKSARSTAQATAIGMEYMDSYIEAMDDQWKLDASTVRATLKSNLSVTGGKHFVETSQGWSPIIAFCSLGKTELVAILIHEGVNVNAVSGPRGTPPLSHTAAWLGNEDVMELLLAAGANPNTANIHGLTPLHFAAAVGNLKVVKILVKAGANIDAEADNFNGIHSLPVFNKIRESQMAAYHKTIDFLIESAADTDLHNTERWTPLQYICICGSAELARRLIELGVPKKPLQILRQKAGSEWAFSGYYTDWATRLEEEI